MADNLTISVGADSSKLRADLAVAQAQVREFATQLRAAAKESLQTGDTSAVAALAGQYDAAVARANGLRAAVKGLGEEHAALHSPLAAAAAAFTNLRSVAGEFGGAIGSMTNSIFPRFKEVLALSIAGAAAEFVHLAESTASAIRETENMARALGFTTDQLEAVELVSSQAGVGQDALGRALARSARALGTLQEEGIKLTGQLPGGVQVLAGSMKNLSDASTVARGSVHQLNESIFAATQVVRGGHKPAIDLAKAFLDIANNPSLSAFEKQLEVADRIDKLKDSTLQAVVAQKQYGRGWVEVIAALRDLKTHVDAAEKEIEGSGLKLSESEKVNARAFNSSLAVMEFYAKRVKEIFGGAFGQALVPVFNEVTDLLKNNSTAIRQFANDLGGNLAAIARDFIALFKGAKPEDLKTDFAKNFVTAKDAIIGAAGAIKTAFLAVLGAADLVAAGINKVLPTNFTGESLLATAAVLKLSGALALLAPAIRLVTAALAFFLANPVGLALTGLALVALTIYQNWETIGPLIQDLWDKYQAFGAWVRAGLADAFTFAWSKIVEAGQAVLDFLDRLWQKAKAAAAAIASALGASSGASSDTAAAPGGFASGGLITGPGSGTSDSILARVSNREYVVNAAAVSRVGVPFLDRVNRGFAMGGLVDAFNSAIALPRFAGGGSVGAGGTPINLQIGNRSYRTSADGSVAGALVREARLRQLSSTGSRPDWAGA